MKKTKLLIFSTVITLMFSACSAVVALASVADRPEKDWAHKAILNDLMNHPAKQLLKESNKVKATKAICNLKYLKSPRKDLLNDYAGKKFCNIRKEDKLFFYDDCINCGSGVDMFSTSYLLVRDNKPFEYVEIERKWSDKLGRSVPIVERLH